MFKFRYTCEEIDRILEDLRREIRYIQDLVKNGEDSEYLLEGIDDLENCIEKNIESLRELNSDMREAAEVQIEDLVSKIDDLNCEIEELEERLELLGGDD